MADNVEVTPGSGETIAADEIAGAKHQRVKITIGADGTNDGDVASGNPMPVTGTVTANPASGTIDTVTTVGTVSACALPTGAATAAKQLADGHNVAVASIAAGDNNIGNVDVASSALPTGAATAANQQTDALTDTELRATPVPVSGTVTANLGATDNAVLDTIATNTGGALTDTELRATAVPVSGTVTANPASGTIDTVSAVTAITNALPAGTNLLGKVGIDQTTDGTTNKVSLSTDVVAVDATGQGDVPVTLDGETVTVDLGANNDVTVTSGTITTTQPKVAITDDAAFMKKHITCTGTDDIVWSPAAGKRWYVTDIFIITDEACTVTLEDDLAGGDSAVMVFPLVANGGATMSFNTPLASGEDAADLIATTTAGNVYITVTGYEV